jgi:2-dehydro-3-deoxyphosphogluconate aldolase / (4S)-4-hydroxy-2-oxoglutarate aldolase
MQSAIEQVSNIEKTAARLRDAGLVAILRGGFGQQALVEIGAALIEVQITAVEVTLNSAGALEAIPEMRKRYGDGILIGAGTCRTLEQVKMAIDAGAHFIVAPNFDPAGVAYSLAQDILHLPGIATPTEAQNAFNAGCKVLKLFPCDVLGGPAYLKAVRAPLDDIRFVPTGGIGLSNLAEYRRAGAYAVGVGTSLVSGLNWTREELMSRAAAMRNAWFGAG